MRTLTNVKLEDLASYFDGLTIHPVVKDNKITSLELRQGDRALHISQDGTYSPNIACHSIEEGTFAERYVLSTPNGELTFEHECEAKDAKRALGLDVEIAKKRVRMEAAAADQAA